MAVKVAYLLGAGASQGSIKHDGSLKDILLESISAAIVKRIDKDKINQLREVRNDLVLEANIEQLITLYEASGISKHRGIAKRLRELFRQEIENIIRELEKTFQDIGKSFIPTLLSCLIDMHSITRLNEKLVLIMTTNYEDLIEKAMEQVHGGINYVVKTIRKDGIYHIKEEVIPLLKLHGSFNWRNEFPILISSKTMREEDVLWIPPGIVKRKESYPFNLIWGKARELLDCDILRIIGSSLSTNDWELLSLLYTTRNLRTDKNQPYIIEIIDIPQKCEELRKQYQYLNFKSILEIPEVQEYLVHTHFSQSIIGKRVVSEDKIKGLAKYMDKENIFALWLRAKGEKLFYSDIPLTTQKNFFQQYIRIGLGEAHGKE